MVPPMTTSVVACTGSSTCSQNAAPTVPKAKPSPPDASEPTNAPSATNVSVCRVSSVVTVKLAGEPTQGHPESERSFRRHACGLDDRRDAGDLAFHQLLQGGRAAVRALGSRTSKFAVPRLNGRIVERLAERVRKLRDDVRGRVPGRDHCVPGAEDEVVSGFPRRRYVRQTG